MNFSHQDQREKILQLLEISRTSNILYIGTLTASRNANSHTLMQYFEKILQRRPDQILRKSQLHQKPSNYKLQNSLEKILQSLEYHRMPNKLYIGQLSTSRNAKSNTFMQYFPKILQRRPSQIDRKSQLHQKPSNYKRNVKRRCKNDITKLLGDAHDNQEYQHLQEVQLH